MHGRDAVAYIGDRVVVEGEVVRRSNTLWVFVVCRKREIVMNFYVPDFCLNGK